MLEPPTEITDVSPRLAHTPSLPLGPFYPVQRRAPAGAALWTADEWPATARRLALQGRVLDAAGRPLHGAAVELWHADPLGRYRHPHQPGADGIAAAFVGYGAQRTDATGAWRFVSLMPASYRAAAGLRAAHVHFQVTHGAGRLVTQMFFPDAATNASDRWYRAVARPGCLVGCVTQDGARSLTVTWDIVMDGAAVSEPDPSQGPSRGHSPSMESQP